MRSRFIAEGSSHPQDPGHAVSSVCVDCPQYQLGRWENKESIQMVHISMTPAPCQSKCIYCEVIKMNAGFNDPVVQENYEKIFDALDYAENCGLISPDAPWLVSSGEITIHPYKDRILDIVKNKNTTFFTNAFLFDEKIDNILLTNPRSYINLSIDAGTPEAWFKIKGSDNFDKIVENLKKYHVGKPRNNIITLKYIMLPGINNSPDNYEGIAKIMKTLDVAELTISRERRSYELSDEQRTELIDSAGALAVQLLKNGLKYTLHSYSPDEKRRVLAIANKQ